MRSLLCKVPLLAFVCILLCSSLTMGAPVFYEDFDGFTPQHFLQPVKGRNQDGTVVSVARDGYPFGPAAIQVDYVFSGAGGSQWVELEWARHVDLDFSGEKMILRMWIKGAGQNHFTRGNIRFADATGEVFQYRFGEMGEVLNGAEWRQFQMELDLNSPEGSWGGNADGVLDYPLRFWGLTFNATTTSGTGTFYLGPIELVEVREQEVTHLSLSLTVPDPHGIIAPHTPIVCSAEVYASLWTLTDNRRLQAVEEDFAGELRWWAVDFDGNQLARGQEQLHLAPGDRVTVDISLGAQQTGIIYLHGELVDAWGNVCQRAEQRIAIMKPLEGPFDSPSFIFAVAAHLGRRDPADIQREVELIRRVGFSAVRFDLTWDKVQPTPEVFNWELYDYIFATLRENGITPLPILCYSTRWASTGDVHSDDWNEWHKAPPQVDAFVRFAREAVARYKDYTRYWEIWNEPDIGFWRGTVEQYAELFNATIAAIHGEDPQALVLNGSFSETKRRPDFIPQFTLLADPPPDIYAFHSHNEFTNLLQAAQDTAGYIEAAGWLDIPVWLNEAGYSTWAGRTERQQASELVKKISYSMALGYQAYVLYDLLNDGENPEELEHNFGIVRWDFSPKAAVVAVRTLMEQLSDKEFLRTLDFGNPEIFALLFGNEGEQTLVIWKQKGDSVLRRIKTNANEVQYVDLMGRRQPAMLMSWGVYVQIKSEPRFVVFKGEDIQLSLD